MSRRCLSHSEHHREDCAVRQSTKRYSAYRIAPEEVLVGDGCQGDCLVLDFHPLLGLNCLHVTGPSKLHAVDPFKYSPEPLCKIMENSHVLARPINVHPTGSPHAGIIMWSHYV